MRPRDLQKRKRNDLAWFLLGFLVVQLALGLGVERFLPTVRDPEFEEIDQIMHERLVEAPGRPLVLVLGSSRTRMALRTERLNHPDDPAAPVVINIATNTSASMLQAVFLKRTLRAGLRPQLVFVEIMPMSLSLRHGAAFEESKMAPGRLTLAEAMALRPYYAEPYRLAVRWLWARLLPADHHQAELREALAIDYAAGSEPGYHSGRDGFGWGGAPAKGSPQEVERLTQETLAMYASALTQPLLSPGAVQALRDVLTLAQREHITAVLVMPPEASVMRNYAPAVAERHIDAVRHLAREFAVPLIDARAWIDDDGFWDGHHATDRGAEQYTARFAREALQPYLSGSSAWTAVPNEH
jgi:hypothetical protein